MLCEYLPTALIRQVIPLSFCPTIHLFPVYLLNAYLWNQLTVDLEPMHMSRSWHRLQGNERIEGQGRGSRSRSWVGLTRLARPRLMALFSSVLWVWCLAACCWSRYWSVAWLRCKRFHAVSGEVRRPLKVCSTWSHAALIISPRYSYNTLMIHSSECDVQRPGMVMVSVAHCCYVYHLWCTFTHTCTHTTI